MTLVIGIDPGPRPGVCALREDDPPMVFECPASSLLPLVRALMEGVGDPRVILAVEQWVIGPISRTARSAGSATRAVIGSLGELAEQPYRGGEVGIVLRRATDVMPWATDKRLDAAGLLAPTAGFKDARAAARHALFSSCRDVGAPDPLAVR